VKDTLFAPLRPLDVRPPLRHSFGDMKNELIAEIGIDDRGRLFVRPAESTYDQIHRAAMGIGWNDETRSLVSPERLECSSARWFEQFLAAVADEFRTALTLGPTTVWIGIAPDLKHEMERFAESGWLQQHLVQRQQNNDRNWQRFQVEQALSGATLLWEEGRYAEYVQVLAPVRQLLSPAQRRRLEIAEGRSRI
jgi:hypothetical protein